LTLKLGGGILWYPPDICRDSESGCASHSLNNGKISNLKDYSSNIRREVNVFNEYVSHMRGQYGMVTPPESMA
jgi:hypothetical protein